jgi:Protein of unknown function (DUF1631)
VLADSRSSRDLAAQARQVFLRHLAAEVDGIAEQVREFLLEQLSLPATAAQAQDRRDAYHFYDRYGKDWVQRVQGELSRLGMARRPGPDPASTTLETAPETQDFSLVEEETVETQILAARAALAALDKGGGAYNDLRLRLQHLEGTEELAKSDPVNALNVAHVLVHSWLAAQLPREFWLLCQGVIQPQLASAIAGAYRATNKFLVDQGIMPEVDWRGLVRRTPATTAAAAEAAPVSAPVPAVSAPAGLVSAATGMARVAVPGTSAQPGGPTLPPGEDVPGRLVRFLSDRLPQAAAWLQGAAAGATQATPEAQATQQAGFLATQSFSPPTVLIDWSSLEKGVAGVRAQVRALKAAAQNQQDKAVIEVVALIFENILTEERIPASIRVWFARLQMPVLRTAVADPGFLASAQHPARQLIDRMGACALGFDAAVSLEPLEREIKRIVQVIEQYPETGRRVFELMLKEFEEFLAKHLHARPSVAQVATVAQQLEQREALTVQYTIEMRKLLGQVAVREPVRDFLFRTWSEVMAQAAIKYGAKDPRTLRIREVPSELLWAASAKGSRHERAQVISKVPALIEHLRAGMSLLGHDKGRQDAAIKAVQDALAEAFMSRAEPIDPAWLQSLTANLARLEQVLPEDDVDLVLDRDNVELITGIDASSITVLPNTDGPLREDMRTWARGLVPGTWFELEHNGMASRVQLVWQSERRQLYLFVTSQQQSFLMQQGRVAAYLQAGLLHPVEVEALTTRATREALVKLDANPERLFS